MRRVYLFAHLSFSALLFFSLVGCIPYHLTERAEIRGSVLDMESHAPIAGAKVYCKGHSDAAVVTSADGKFDLPPKKKWQIVAIYGDYFPLGCALAIEAAGYDSGKDWSNSVDTVVYLRRSANPN